MMDHIYFADANAIRTARHTVQWWHWQVGNGNLARCWFYNFTTKI